MKFRNPEPTTDDARKPALLVLPVRVEPSEPEATCARYFPTFDALMADVAREEARLD